MVPSLTHTVQDNMTNTSGDVIAQGNLDNTVSKTQEEKPIRRSSRKHTASPLEWSKVPYAMEGHLGNESTVNLVTQHQTNSMMNMIAEALVAAQDIGEPRTLREAMSSPDRLRWKEAIDSEYESLMRNETWNLMPLPLGRRTVSNKWLFKRKLNPDGSTARFKARLVVRGFTQEEGLDYTETFSPVVRFSSVHTLLAIAAREGYLTSTPNGCTNNFLKWHLGRRSLY